MKKKFAYVVAYTVDDDPDEMLCFKHHFYEAKNADEAYTLGMQEEEKWFDKGEKKTLVNNYVFEIPKEKAHV